MSLKWKELELVLSEAKKSLEGGILQKFAQSKELGRGESYVMQGHHSGGGAWRFWVSLLQDHTTTCLLPDSYKFEAAAEPSHFVMILRKHLLGKSLRSVEQLGDDRIFFLHFDYNLSLLCELIPRRANMILLENWEPDNRRGKSLASHRKISLETGGYYVLPPVPKEVRGEVDEYISSAPGKVNRVVAEQYLAELGNLDFFNEKRLWLQAVKSQQKKVAGAVASNEKELQDAQEAELFQKRGKALTAHLYELGPRKFPKEKKITLDEVEITLDPLKTFADNAEACFKKSKKFVRAVGELEKRKLELEERALAVASLLAKIEKSLDLAGLEKLQSYVDDLGIVPGVASQGSKGKEKEAKPFLELTSSDGFLIYCGRNQEENRRVTFQESKGNDLWLHVKGMPGAHVVVRAQKKKTVPLQTLLEAAQITLYYSKIRKGKRAEVDYTFRKYVKAIKGTLAEVTYTENKTLYVDANAEVIKKLMRD